MVISNPIFITGSFTAQQIQDVFDKIAASLLANGDGFHHVVIVDGEITLVHTPVSEVPTL